MPFYETEDRVKLYYEDHGSGAPIVLVHGLTANHRHFKYQIAGLRDAFRIIAYDLRGHGASDLPDHGLNITRLAYDLKELIDYLDPGPVSVVGWSLGAHVVFEFIQAFGCRNISSFTIIDMTPRLMKADVAGGDAWGYGLRGFSGKYGDFGHGDNSLMLAAIAGSDWREFSRNLVERLYDRALTKEGRFDYEAGFKGKADMEWLLEQAMRNKPCAIASLWASMAVRDYRNLLDDILVPVLITYGEGSNYYPKENSEYMHSRLKRSKLVSFPGCGHALQIQDPEKFNSVLRGFLEDMSGKAN